MFCKNALPYLIAAALSINTPYTAASPASEVESYLIALNSMSPTSAQHTIVYKTVVEKQCGKALTVNQLRSTGFNNVIHAMESSETVVRMGLDGDGSALQDTLAIVGKNISCSDLNAPFSALLSDAAYNKKHEHLSKILRVWNEVTGST